MSINIAQIKPVEILLIEDNPVDARMAKEALNDFRVAKNLYTVTDGEKGMSHLPARRLQKCATSRLTLLDLNLPKKDGREILEEVKADVK